MEFAKRTELRLGEPRVLTRGRERSERKNITLYFAKEMEGGNGATNGSGITQFAEGEPKRLKRI